MILSHLFLQLQKLKHLAQSRAQAKLALILYNHSELFYVIIIVTLNFILTEFIDIYRNLIRKYLINSELL